MQPPKENPPKRQNYHSYLLRCWHLSDDANKDPSQWRFILEEIMGTEKMRFDNLDDLIHFLEATFDPNQSQSDNSSKKTQS